jgi:hypothetical protein
MSTFGIFEHLGDTEAQNFWLCFSHYCGKPGGRPKVVAEVRELARAHCPNAIAELARLALRKFGR